MVRCKQLACLSVSLLLPLHINNHSFPCHSWQAELDEDERVDGAQAALDDRKSKSKKERRADYADDEDVGAWPMFPCP